MAFPASLRGRGAAGPGACPASACGRQEARVDAGLVRMLALGAVVAVVFALEVWALCVVAAQADDDLGQR